MKRILVILCLCFFLCPFCALAADITTGAAYVDTNLGTDNATCGTSTGAGACATLAYMFGTRVKDLTGPLVVHCKGTAADTGLVTVSCATTATNTVTIQVDQSDRHKGVYSASYYRHEYSANQNMSVNVSYVYIDGLQISNGHNNRSNIVGACDSSGNLGLQISNCILRSTASSAQPSVYVTTWNIIKVFNCMIYGFNGTGGSGIRCRHSSSRILNNTIANCSTGWVTFNDNPVLINNLFYSCTTAASGTVGSLTDYNATDLSSMGYTPDSPGGTHDFLSQTFAFVSTSTPDYHLSASNGAPTGTSDPGSGLYSTDIDAQTRTSWYVGADEYISTSAIGQLLNLLGVGK